MARKPLIVGTLALLVAGALLGKYFYLVQLSYYLRAWLHRTSAFSLP